MSKRPTEKDNNMFSRIREGMNEVKQLADEGEPSNYAYVSVFWAGGDGGGIGDSITVRVDSPMDAARLRIEIRKITEMWDLQEKEKP